MVTYGTNGIPQIMAIAHHEFPDQVGLDEQQRAGPLAHIVERKTGISLAYVFTPKRFRNRKRTYDWACVVTHIKHDRDILVD